MAGSYVHFRDLRGDSAPPAVPKQRLVTGNASIALFDYEMTHDFFRVFTLPNRFLLWFSLDMYTGGYGSYLDFDSRLHHIGLGQMVMLPPNITIELRSTRRHIRALSCSFKFADATVDDFGIPVEWNAAQLHAAMQIKEGTAVRYMRELSSALITDRFGGAMEAECLARLAFINACRAIPGFSGEPLVHALAPWQLNAIENRVMADQAPTPTLSELARLCRISERHMTRAFRKTRGITIGNFIREVNTGRAQRMLRSMTPINEIAVLLGYGSTCAFSTAFRRETGVSPSAYRRNENS